MTIVAAIVTPKGAWLGSDSVSSDGDVLNVMATSKIGKFGGKLLGFAGSWDGHRIMEIARRHPDLTFSEIVFRSGTFDAGLSLLCVEAGQLYFVQTEKSMIRYAKKRGVVYGAAGSGEAVALGSLYSWHDGREALLNSLKAAQEHVPTVRGPFKIVSI